MANKQYNHIFKANAILNAIFGLPLTIGASFLFLTDKESKIVSLGMLYTILFRL